MKNQPTKKKAPAKKKVDTTSPDADSVKQYLAESTAAELLGETPTPTPPEKEEEEKSKENAHITLTSDTSFDTDVREKIVNLFVSTKDGDIPVTEHDKVLYLKATLHESPVVLDIEMAQGLTCTCRSLTVYEGDLVYAALSEYVKRNNEMNVSLLDAIVQQYRLAMQLTSTQLAGEAVKLKPSLNFTYKDGELADHVEQLISVSNAQLLNTQAPLYGLYIRALNVFQLKLNKLQEMAFNKNFWMPDAIA